MAAVGRQAPPAACSGDSSPFLPRQKRIPMDHLDIPQMLGLLVAMLAGATLGGALARAVGQPAVLGELVAGVVLGRSVLGLVDPEVETVRLLAELGVVLLLFAIGLETDLRKLLAVGATSAAVAAVGVALPFALGYAA